VKHTSKVVAARSAL